MADTKISALSAAASAALTDQYPIADAVPASKKVTGTQMSALFANPASNEGDDLGTAALRWLNLFLGNGGKIDFNNGNVTLTHSAKLLTLAGGTFKFAVGADAAPPILLQAGTLETTPQDGGIEIDNDCLYGCTDAGNRGVIPIEHIIRADATRTFANNTNQQAIFTTPTNGTLTLETGTYLFEGLVAITVMSGTSGNGKFSLIGAGTATLGAILWTAFGHDVAAEATAGATGGSWHVIATQTAANIVTAATTTALCFNVRGTFEVTGAGTIIPSFALTTAVATAVVSIGSYFKCNRIGSTSMTSVGQWT